MATQTEAIHKALARVIRERGQTYAGVAELLGLSLSSVKRLFSQAQLSIQRMEVICHWLGVDVADVVKLAEARREITTQLTAEQEQALLADKRLLLCAFLVLNRWKAEEIVEIFAFSTHDLTRMLVQLERLKLIELLPFDRVKVRAARNFSWRKNGPIESYFQTRVMKEFLGTRFDAPGEKMRFVGGMLSRKSVHVLHEKLEQLAHTLDELATEDATLPAADRFGVSLFAAVRPWELSDFTQLRREPPSKVF